MYVIFQECVNALKVESQNLDNQLQVYEKYFVEMRKHMKKKEDICQDLEKTAAEKGLFFTFLI